jgi:hypothetical protein
MSSKDEDVEGHKWKGPLPKGWTDKSRKKFWDSLTSRAPKHKVSQCIKRMGGKVDNPGAFCASLADRVIPGWRQEAAKERRKKNAKFQRGLRSLRLASETLAQPLSTRRDYGEQKRVDPEKLVHSVLPGDDISKTATRSPWITRQEMQKLCPQCAVRMKKAGLKKVHVAVFKRMQAL